MRGENPGKPLTARPALCSGRSARPSPPGGAVWLAFGFPRRPLEIPAGAAALADPAGSVVPGGSEAPSRTASGDIFSGRRGRVLGLGGGGPCGGGEIPFGPGWALTAALRSPPGPVLRGRRRQWPSRPAESRPGRCVPRRGALSGRGGAAPPRSAGEAGRGAGQRPGRGLGEGPGGVGGWRAARVRDLRRPPGL